MRPPLLQTGPPFVGGYVYFCKRLHVSMHVSCTTPLRKHKNMKHWKRSSLMLDFKHSNNWPWIKEVQYLQCQICSNIISLHNDPLLVENNWLWACHPGGGGRVHTKFARMCVSKTDGHRSFLGSIWVKWVNLFSLNMGIGGGGGASHSIWVFTEPGTESRVWK